MSIGLLGGRGARRALGLGRPRISATGLGVLLFTLVVGFVVVYPVFMLFWGSFQSAAPGEEGQLGLSGYLRAYADPSVVGVFVTTVWLSAVRTVLALGLALFLAWVVARTDTPWRGLLEILIMSIFFLPVLPMVVAWALLAAPRSGLLNAAWMGLLNVDAPLFDIYSYGGIIWVSVINWAAVAFVIMLPAFKRMDAALEESSRMSGASSLRTFVRVTLPLMMPALLGAGALTFVRMMESFEIELFLGLQPRIFVFTTKIFQYMRQSIPADYPPAMALSTTLLIITYIVVLAQWRMLGGRQYVVISGRGYQARPMSLGRWRWVTFAIVLGYFAVTVLLPAGTLVFSSFMKLAGVYMEDMFTLEHYSRALGHPQLLTVLRNTLIMTVGAATIGMLLCTIMSYVIVRTSFRVRWALDLISWVPYTVPGLVLALGFLWAYVGGLPLPFTLYGTLYLLILVFVVRTMPWGVRTMNGTLVQLDKGLEESSRILGASWLRTFVGIVLPLVWPGFVAGWMLAFVISFRDLTTAILLYGAQSRVLSILIYEYWSGGRAGEAAVLGLLMTAVGLVFVIGENLLRRRTERVSVA